MVTSRIAATFAGIPIRIITNDDLAKIMDKVSGQDFQFNNEYKGRQDEIGTPYCICYDFDSENDQAVTIRDRDTMEQVRVPIAELKNWFDEKFDF